MSPTIQTYTGKEFFPLSPRIEDFDIEDIAHSLSLTCRFSGHCKMFYSVAQHSVIVASMLPHELKLQGLMHDVSEAYLPDVASPIKSYIQGFRDLEMTIMVLASKRYGFDWPEHPLVRKADLTALLTEKRDIMSPCVFEWTKIPGIEELPEPIIPVDPDTAKQLFLAEFKVLTDSLQK